MAKFEIKLVQQYQTIRTIVYEIEAKSAEAAKAIVDAEIEDGAPAYDDPRWQTEQGLEEEWTYFD